MREILSRGQTRRKGEKVWMDGSPVESNWVYGGIFQGGDRSVIYSYYPIEKHVVYSDTVGQFTGRTDDKNGKKIFEHDIVRCIRSMCDGKEIVGHIVYDECCFSVKENKSPNQPAMDLCDCFEVIGNIHDNPELLEVEWQWLI